jgi:predicted nucleotidyltransferase
MDKFDTPEGTILLAYRGSIAHGMYVPDSDPDSIDDVDLIGFVIPEARFYVGLSEWGSRGTQDYWRGHYDYVFYELRKAVSLLLRGNPNVVSVLWLRPEHYLFLSDAGRALLDHRDLFVGKHVYDAFAGYAQTQLEKMETRDPAELREYMSITAELKARGLHPNHKGEHIPRSPDHPPEYESWSSDKLIQRLASYRKKGENIGYMGEKRKSLVLRHGYDAKNAAHCIRLLRMCKEFLFTGYMEVYRTRDAEELLDIKRGKWSLDEVKKHARELFEDIAAARDASPLPDAPDRDAVERLLINLIGSKLRATA